MGGSQSDANDSTSISHKVANRHSEQVVTAMNHRERQRFQWQPAGAASALVLLLVLAGAIGPALAQVEAAPAAFPPWHADEDLIVEALERGEVVSMERIGEGITNPYKVGLQHRGRELSAVWKPLARNAQRYPESYPAEIAAYRLSRFLEIDMVPPTVLRKVRGRRGSMQLWVDDHRRYADVVAKRPPDFHQRPEMEVMRFFDELIDNPDRNAANFLVSSDWKIVLIDHSRAMNYDQRAKLRDAPMPERFSVALVSRVRDLELAELIGLLGDILPKSDLKSLLRARKRLLTYVETIVAERGDRAFFDLETNEAQAARPQHRVADGGLRP